MKNSSTKKVFIKPFAVFNNPIDLLEIVNPYKDSTRGLFYYVVLYWWTSVNLPHVCVIKFLSLVNTLIIRL